MSFEKLKSFEGLDRHRRLKEEWIYAEALLYALKQQQDLSADSLLFINAQIKDFNASSHTIRTAISDLSSLQNAILRQVRVSDNIRLKNYYKSHWMILGILAIGTPLGLLFHAFTEINILVGLILGLGCGFLIGYNKDRKQGMLHGFLDIDASIQTIRQRGF